WMLSSCCQAEFRISVCPDRPKGIELFVNRFARAGFIKLPRLLNEREKLGTISSEIFTQTASSDFLDVLPRDILALGRAPQLHSECRHGGDFRARSHGDFRQVTRVTIECLVAQFDSKQLVCVVVCRAAA
ncbi:MAG TPA: hypothetical protein VIZ87_09375, partial [Terrimicrobium sp.]